MLTGWTFRQGQRGADLGESIPGPKPSPCPNLQQKRPILRCPSPYREGSPNIRSTPNGPPLALKRLEIWEDRIQEVHVTKSTNFFLALALLMGAVLGTPFSYGDERGATQTAKHTEKGKPSSRPVAAREQVKVELPDVTVVYNGKGLGKYRQIGQQVDGDAVPLSPDFVAAMDVFTREFEALKKNPKRCFLTAVESETVRNFFPEFSFASSNCVTFEDLSRLTTPVIGEGSGKRRLVQIWGNNFDSPKDTPPLAVGVSTTDDRGYSAHEKTVHIYPKIDKLTLEYRSNELALEHIYLSLLRSHVGHKKWDSYLSKKYAENLPATEKRVKEALKRLPYTSPRVTRRPRRR